MDEPRLLRVTPGGGAAPVTMHAPPVNAPGQRVQAEMSLRGGHRFGRDMTAQPGRTEESREARRAFMPKRDPAFQGR